MKRLVRLAAFAALVTTVALPARRVGRLRALLRRVGNSFDQRAIHLEVAGFAELLTIREEHGWLEIG